MRSLLLVALCFFSVSVQALEYQKEFENEQVSIARVKIMPSEEIGLHRDSFPQVVIALKGGVITRLEADGSETDVLFPTGVAVSRGVDPEGELHRSVNRGKDPVELIVIQLKQE